MGMIVKRGRIGGDFMFESALELGIVIFLLIYSVMVSLMLMSVKKKS